MKKISRGFGIQITLDSNLKPYRPQDGIIKAGEDYFAYNLLPFQMG